MNLSPYHRNPISLPPENLRINNQNGFNYSDDDFDHQPWVDGALSEVSASKDCTMVSQWSKNRLSLLTSCIQINYHLFSGVLKMFCSRSLQLVETRVLILYLWLASVLLPTMHGLHYIMLILWIMYTDIGFLCFPDSVHSRISLCTLYTPSDAVQRILSNFFIRGALAYRFNTDCGPFVWLY